MLTPEQKAEAETHLKRVSAEVDLEEEIKSTVSNLYPNAREKLKSHHRHPLLVEGRPQRTDNYSLRNQLQRTFPSNPRSPESSSVSKPKTDSFPLLTKT